MLDLQRFLYVVALAHAFDRLVLSGKSDSDPLALCDVATAYIDYSGQRRKLYTSFHDLHLILLVTLPVYSFYVVQFYIQAGAAGDEQLQGAAEVVLSNKRCAASAPNLPYSVCIGMVFRACASVLWSIIMFGIFPKLRLST